MPPLLVGADQAAHPNVSVHHEIEMKLKLKNVHKNVSFPLAKTALGVSSSSFSITSSYVSSFKFSI